MPAFRAAAGFGAAIGYTRAAPEGANVTVAAVILAASASSALADADGTPAVRRIADTAWAGGATPIIVCVHDSAGRVAAALANTDASLVEPVAASAGPAGQIANGIESALWLVGRTNAALVWPARLAWADAETVTTLIAGHGEHPGAILQPTYGGLGGFPLLVPVAALPAVRALTADRMPGDLAADLAAGGWPVVTVDTGDPGVAHDIATPRAELPPFDGPPQPADEVARDWGAATADALDDEPVPGPDTLSAASRSARNA
jgi:CTP:molybdopterin cytidylyltransferase MocA